MNDIRIIEQQEVKSCADCPLANHKEYADGWDADIFDCYYENELVLNRSSKNRVHKNCPLPKKEEIENRTCRTCKHLNKACGFEIYICKKYDIVPIRGDKKEFIDTKFVNDPNKHCWEERDE